MIFWTAHFIGGPLGGKTELCRGRDIEPTLRTVTLREGEAFWARDLPEDAVPVVNAYLIHEYQQDRVETTVEDRHRFFHVYYRWAGEPKIPQVEGVL